MIQELEQILYTYKPLLEKADGAIFLAKALPGKWSKKEILGHLIDSAQNNIRRFVMGQYEEQPSIGYNQDQWVVITHYKFYDKNDLIALWTLINKHILIILKNSSPEAGKRLVKTQGLHSIEWLAADYNRHLLHHLHVLLDMEPISYP